MGEVEGNVVAVSSSCFKNQNSGKAEANVVCKVVNRERKKLKAVSDTVWVCWKAVIVEKTRKEELIDKNYSNDNYSYIAPASL